MLKKLIKRSGEVQDFEPSKSNQWLIWGAKDIAHRLDWSTLVMSARGAAPEQMTTQEWQMFLITALRQRGTADDGWPYMLMAGRLYTIYLMKAIHGDGYPILKDHLAKMRSLNLVRDMGYSESELDYIQQFIIDHEANLTMAHPQVEQYFMKYSLRDQVTGTVFETPQLTMIRSAMAVCEGDQPVTRLKRVKEIYDELREDTINPPTPNYAALGTRHYGMASCCLIAAGDDAKSILVAGTIGYMMTLASGGLGIHLSTRTHDDPVDGGRVRHAGRLNYQRFFVGGTAANKQGMRGGALNVYDTIYSPEAEQNLFLQNPRTPVEARERRINITYQTNAFFIKLAAANKEYFTFTEFSAPDLYKSFFKADQTEFEQLYNKYAQDDSFPKTWLDARKTLTEHLAQEIEISTVFWNDPSEMNRHTPFKDTVIQSNLCVAPETPVLTDRGYFVISGLVNKPVNVWNGQAFTPTIVQKTATNTELIQVSFSNGVKLNCTPYHKFYVTSPEGVKEVRANELVTGSKLIEMELPLIETVHDEQTGQLFSIEERINAFNQIFAARGGIIGNDAETTAVVTFGSEVAALEALRMLQTLGIQSFVHTQEQSGSSLTLSFKNMKKLFALGAVFENMTQEDFDAVFTEEVQEETVKVTGLVDFGRTDDTYCFTETERHMGVFAGVITGQCMEVMTPTAPWRDIPDLYGDGNPENGETGICNIGSIAIHNLPFDPRNPLIGYDRYKRAVRAMMEIIDYAIDNSEYHFPAIRIQARSRRNCSVGMSGVATLMAKLNLPFNTAEGRRVWHMLNERHAYACIEVALELGKERGNAPWMHRTKWPDGWMPIDTYKKKIDDYVDSTLQFDWEDLRSRVIDNKGIRFSCLIAHMPGEQATRKGNGSNSIYPLLGLSVDKSDGSMALPWAALDNDLIGDQYQTAYQLSDEDIYIHYGICQKFTDQGISADDYMNRIENPDVTESILMNRAIWRVRVGMKSKYYSRSLTGQGGKQQDIQIAATEAAEDGIEMGVSCTLDGNCGA